MTIIGHNPAPSVYKRIDAKTKHAVGCQITTVNMIDACCQEYGNDKYFVKLYNTVTKAILSEN